VIAQVEPLTTARALRGPFDYRLPAHMENVGVGSLLLVPFGRQRIAAVVTGVAPTSELPPERLAEPIAALEAGTPAELARLGLWVADEYCSTPARGLELVLPPRRPRPGQRARVPTDLTAEITEAGRAALAGGVRLGDRQRAALEGLAAATGEMADRAVLRRLETRGLVVLREERSFRRPEAVSVGVSGGRPELTVEQRASVAAIVAGLDAPEGREFLLHGITGSGKTEVYLAAAEAALERGRSVIALVPEIGLTPQGVSRFAARFGDRIAVLHSKLSAGERRDEWERLRSGAARVCVGPRSAVFAPLRDLGLVVVDEEHDASYKQEGDPRYDERDVARRRVELAAGVLVAGTATPRPESWLRLERLELTTRVDGLSLPPVEVLDMRGRDGRAGPLHPRTSAELAAVAEHGGKAIVLVNRRGWSPFLSCRACGSVRECPSCEVSLVVHRAAERLRCHHCAHSEPVPRECPDCGSVTLAQVGTGTERAAEVIAAAVGGVPVFRLDADTAARKGQHAAILKRFEAAGAAVMVGTQMVAKGHDFPDVVLSVVLDADASLRFPDFRSEERTFAMVAQLAGRSGRGPRGGRVLVQTLAPDAPAIASAARHDAPGFLAGELERRRALRYPPFASLVRVELAAPDPGRVDQAAALTAEAIAANLPPDADLLGPAPRLRLRGRERRQLLIKAAERGPAVAAVRSAVEASGLRRPLRGVALSVDVEPQ
jgi:primosomal protein N' (replication factor Y)